MSTIRFSSTYIVTVHFKAKLFLFPAFDIKQLTCYSLRVDEELGL